MLSVMKNVQYPYQQQPPLIDPSKLRKNEKIRFKYDHNGNLTEIYVEDRNEGCFVFIVFTVLALAAVYAVKFYVL